MNWPEAGNIIPSWISLTNSPVTGWISIIDGIKVNPDGFFYSFHIVSVKIW